MGIRCLGCKPVFYRLCVASKSPGVCLNALLFLPIWPGWRFRALLAARKMFLTATKLYR